MKPYYYVYNVTKRTPPLCRHNTLSEAVAEAERLATKQKGESFEVLKAMSLSHVTKPVVTYYMDGVYPEGAHKEVTPGPF